MAKYCGKIGYVAEEEETRPGYWEPVIKIRRDTKDSEYGSNDDILLNSRLSIISDAFANENYSKMRYATINNVKWKITNIDINYPRIIIDLGGLYNDTGRKED